METLNKSEFGKLYIDRDRSYIAGQTIMFGIIGFGKDRTLVLGTPGPEEAVKILASQALTGSLDLAESEIFKTWHKGKTK
jgi:hypothetical protein